MNSFYTKEELSILGLKSYGDNVLISRKVSIYSPQKISVGNNVRIDDYCLLSGEITLGNNIHISAYSALYGAMGIEFKNNSGCSARTTIYSAMDDFSGDYLIGPMQPENKTHVTGGKVTIGEYVQLGAHCLVFPNLTIGTGSVVGALSLVTKDIPEWGIYVGIPAKFLRERSKNLVSLSK
ncbi:MAG: acyltransferase [Paludibacteraceae bacterium]|nr:acyltransferase [Paludibacteraceae bacterium]